MSEPNTPKVLSAQEKPKAESVPNNVMQSFELLVQVSAMAPLNFVDQQQRCNAEGVVRKFLKEL